MTVLVEGICPLITHAVLSLCHDANIRTLTDFIIYDPEELAKKIHMSYKDVLSVRRSLLERYAAFPQNGESVVHELMDSLSILDTGSKKLNTYLKGGIYSGEVTEIHGSAGSGKTQFCLSLTSKLLLETDNTVVYLNISNNFSAERLKEIILHNSSINSALLQNVTVKNIYNIYDFFDCIEIIKDQLHKKENTFYRHLKLLIIDSITSLISPCFGGKCLDGPGIQNNIAQQFKILCTSHMLSVLVCNDTVGDSNFSVKPALGSNWKYIPSVSLCVSKLSSRNHKISTVKSCRNGLFNQVSIQITEAGVCD